MTSMRADAPAGKCAIRPPASQSARSVPLPLLPASYRLGLWSGAYFPNDKVSLLSGDLSHHRYQTQSGNNVTTNFCSACGTTTHWQIDSEFLGGKTAIAVGTFDPPSFWFDITREIFLRTKAPFVEIDAENKFETSGTYKPVKEDDDRQNPGK